LSESSYFLAIASGPVLARLPKEGLRFEPHFTADLEGPGVPNQFGFSTLINLSAAIYVAKLFVVP